MRRLVIDYVLDGENRGYSFVTPTDHLAAPIVKTLWQQAMPRGQGWAADVYRGARSLKCIPLDDGRMAVCDVTVTDKRDELGRQGLRRAEITLMTSADYERELAVRWERLPTGIRQEAESKFGIRLWKRLIDLAMPKVRGETQLVVTYPYTTSEAWQVVEAFLLRLMTARHWRYFRSAGFTTLALDYREESPIVALPLVAVDQLKPGKDVSIVYIS